MENLYKLYSATLIDPISFEDFVANFHQKWKQAYQVGIVEPYNQLALIDYHHKPTQNYGFGFGNGIKLAMAIMKGDGNIEFEKPEAGEGDELLAIVEALKKTIANLKGQITKLKKKSNWPK